MPSTPLRPPAASSMRLTDACARQNRRRTRCLLKSRPQRPRGRGPRSNIRRDSRGPLSAPWSAPSVSPAARPVQRFRSFASHAASRFRRSATSSPSRSTSSAPPEYHARWVHQEDYAPFPASTREHAATSEPRERRCLPATYGRSRSLPGCRSGIRWRNRWRWRRNGIGRASRPAAMDPADYLREIRERARALRQSAERLRVHSREGRAAAACVVQRRTGKCHLERRRITDPNSHERRAAAEGS
jgi:hypothetical protein